MANTVPLTNIDKYRVFHQISKNLTQLQRDIVNNAQTHKTMALAQSPSVPVLASFLNDAAASYLTRLQWCIDLRADVTKKAQLIDLLNKFGMTEVDITDKVTPLVTGATAIQNANKTTYAQIINICNTILSTVDAPFSLWPE